ncbi:hypothetical protein ACFY4B_27405 [Kitasatospora sp. NPDC001261]|uniref:hypothetical protein n=1 Tax=Kitasatospora sp. NPDC001261 TaxID=3364012 RepID=UPI0036C9506B
MPQNTNPTGEHQEQRHLGSYGLLRFTTATDLTTGTCAYKLTGPHVRGIATLVPAAATADPTDPNEQDRRWQPDLLIFYGAEPVAPHRHRADPLTINGVQLGSITRVSYDQVDRGDPISARRPNKAGHAITLPPATRRHAEAVLLTVVDHWRARPDLAELDEAAQRANAPRWLAEQLKKLDQHDERLAELDNEVSYTRTARRLTIDRVRQLRALAAGTDAAAA